MTPEIEETSQRLTALEREIAERDQTIARLEKIRRALIERSVRSGGGELRGYGLLENQVVLFEQVRRRTRELEELSAKLLAAKEEAEAAARVRTTFLTTMSHEIRTPLNGILGMAALLAGTELNAEQAEYARTIRICGSSLLDLINNILDFSKLESRGLERESLVFDPRDLIDNVGVMVADRIQSKGLTFVPRIGDGVPASVVGDPGRLRQVLLNLVGNAVKFTESGSITVDVEAVINATPRLAFRVTDSGVGISNDVAARLFQPFVQADPSTTRKFGGSGLGLAICRQIVERLGGEIGLDSVEGLGSAFWFWVPVELVDRADSARAERSDREAPCTEASARTAGKRTSAEGAERVVLPCRALLVEDNIVNQKVAVALLRRLGAEVDVAANGLQAVEACRQGAYDIVFMDCQMPVMDGYEAAATIRREEAGRSGGVRLPIIALTAHAMPGDRQKCVDAGMDDYVTKPVSSEDLVAALETWARRCCRSDPAGPEEPPGSAREALRR